MTTPTSHVLPRPAAPHWPGKVGATALLAVLAALGAGQALAQPQPAAPAAPPAAMHHPGMHQAMHHRMAPGMPMAGPMIPERMLDAVGASAEQKTRLREIFKSAGDDMRAQHDARHALHQQMAALMAAPQVDAAAAEALRQKELAAHDTASKRMLQAMLDAQAVLTPEQRAKLAERMAERHRRMEQSQERHERHERRAPPPPAAPKG